MQIILWRHAQAHMGENDLARCLTEKGHKQARKIAKVLQLELPENYQVWVSEAMRSQQTAAYLATQVQCFSVLNPNSQARDIYQLLHQKIQPNETIVIVGHQPWIGELCSLLLNQQHITQNYWSVKKGAFWWFSAQHYEDGFGVRLEKMQAP